MKHSDNEEFLFQESQNKSHELIGSPPIVKYNAINKERVRSTKASRSADQTAEWIWDKYYNDEDSKYKEKLCFEHKIAITNRFSNQSKDRDKLIEKLEGGEYPSLDWVTKCMGCQNLVPGLKNYPPGEDGYPPRGKQQRGGSSGCGRDETSIKSVLDKSAEILQSISTSIASVTNNVSSDVHTTSKAEAVEFFRVYANNKKHNISVQIFELDENGFTVTDLINKAKNKCRTAKIPMFCAPCKEKKWVFDYKFRGQTLLSQDFKNLSFDFLFNDPAPTVKIEIVVREDIDLDWGSDEEIS